MGKRWQWIEGVVITVVWLQWLWQLHCYIHSQQSPVMQVSFFPCLSVILEGVRAGVKVVVAAPCIAPLSLTTKLVAVLHRHCHHLNSMYFLLLWMVRHAHYQLLWEEWQETSSLSHFTLLYCRILLAFKTEWGWWGCPNPYVHWPEVLCVRNSEKMKRLLRQRLCITVQPNL